jgi:hypothetical protein
MHLAVVTNNDFVEVLPETGAPLLETFRLLPKYIKLLLIGTPDVNIE